MCKWLVYTTELYHFQVGNQHWFITLKLLACYSICVICIILPFIFSFFISRYGIPYLKLKKFISELHQQAYKLVIAVFHIVSWKVIHIKDEGWRLTNRVLWGVPWRLPELGRAGPVLWGVWFWTPRSFILASIVPNILLSFSVFSRFGFVGVSSISGAVRFRSRAALLGYF
jgi:hypothetical protein